MTAMSVAMIGPWLHGPGYNWGVGIAGAAGALFFGPATLLIVWRALTSAGPVVTLTPTGIRDIRVASAEIPWDAVRGISTWSHQGQNAMVIAVTPEIEAGLGLTAMTRMTRKANRALGADGLCITAQGLKTTYQDLLETTLAYIETHRSRPGA
jgi:hypothetical protein